MRKKMMFIFNPFAGKAQIKNKLIDILDIFTKNDFEITIYPTQRGEDAMELIRDLPEGIYELVVCSGGDGTLDQVVTGMMKRQEKIPIGYIPTGSTNDFANSLKIPKNIVKAAEVTVGNDYFLSDIGSFNHDNFVYIAAFGIFTDVSYQTKQEVKNILGHAAYILEGVKRLSSIRSYQLKIECNGEIIEDEFIFGMVTNSISVGGFKNMTGKNVLLDDGLFEAAFIKKPNNPIELQEIIATLLIEDLNSQYICSYKTNRVVFSSEEAIPWTLDGEFGGEHKEAVIINNKQALSIKVDLEQKLLIQQHNEKENNCTDTSLE
ncbi:diacylglycerol/lipid kinase family protein [Lachnotalea glycerini]|uniref:YegS/Rv2252/BmrU family lipid kinase n=2 Tax=Lachnotalea glycerini TaxID=1763509 RepID=A0A371JAQ9_9FIRM|nr:YegS/Rv2252/BmrU family lipid kinase [Lachnotalea glycerini]RDY29842.1 YegS/Rv2252/BmrU family lipid kinase [Lachnotalea glycerini]